MKSSLKEFALHGRLGPIKLGVTPDFIRNLLGNRSLDVLDNLNGYFGYRYKSVTFGFPKDEIGPVCSHIEIDMWWRVSFPKALGWGGMRPSQRHTREFILGWMKQNSIRYSRCDTHHLGPELEVYMTRAGTRFNFEMDEQTKAFLLVAVWTEAA